MVGGIGGYLLHFKAHSKTLWLSQNLCATAWRNKKKRCQAWGEGFLGVANMAMVPGEIDMVPGEIDPAPLWRQI
jgi:hypothetical protein